MQPQAYLITTARGGIVDEAALADALEQVQIVGAGIDVWEVEPPPLTHRFLTFDNVVGTYHTAGVTVDCRKLMATRDKFSLRFEKAFGFLPQQQ